MMLNIMMQAWDTHAIYMDIVGQFLESTDWSSLPQQRVARSPSGACKN